ncbi:hypothetical protein [Macrococcus equi]|uniref:hypothetical protein n=1 Tax=Macrococcus equi TaxID=3395462 RepID=UPI0039BDFBE0
MDVVDILINQLPEPLRDFVRECNEGEVIIYFLEEANPDLAYIISTIATHIDTIASHRMAVSLFEHAIIWMPSSFPLASFHVFRILELQGFDDVDEMKSFMMNVEHPDYDQISNEYFRFVAQKIKAIDTDYNKSIPNNVYDIELPDILNKKVVKAMKDKIYAFKTIPFGITRKDVEKRLGTPTELLNYASGKYISMLSYESRYKNKIFAFVFKGEKELADEDYIFIGIEFYYEMHQQISKDQLIGIWGKPDTEGITMGDLCYHYGDINISLYKNWEDKFYVKQVWYGSDEVTKIENEKFIFEN